MEFFFNDNPIALFLALVLVVAVLKIVLSKQKWLQGKSAAYVTLILIAVAMLLILYKPLLSMISFSVPFFALLAIFACAIISLLFAFGMRRESIWPALKGIGMLKTVTYIAIFCIIALAASRVYGDKLLEEPKVSLGDAISPPEEPVEIDFSAMFSKQALGMIMLMVVLGMAFFFVNSR